MAWDSFHDYPMCDEKYARTSHGGRGSSFGISSQVHPCYNYAEFKDEGRLVCSRHSRKTRTKLLVRIRRGGRGNLGKVEAVD